MNMYMQILEFAKQRNLSVHENRKSKAICAYVVLDNKGEYQGIEYIDKKSREVKRIPDFGSFSTTAYQPNPIVETVEHIFDKLSKKYPYWVSTMLSGKGTCSSLDIICDFINKYDTDGDFYNRVNDDIKNSGLSAKDVISFRIDSNPVEDLNDWDNWLCSKVYEFKSRKNLVTSEKIISSVSGELQDPCPPTACPSIKNIPNDIKAAFNLSMGAGIVSMNYNSYQSYGFDGACGSQMGIDDAKLLVAGFEYLLSNEQNRNKDFGIIYMCDKTHIENLIHEVLQDRNDQLDDDDICDEINMQVETDKSLLSNILQSVYAGNKCPVIDSDAIFHMAKFNVPSQGRFYLSDIADIKYTDLQHSLYKWYEDTKIINCDKTFVIRYLYHVLLSCLINDRASDTTKQVNIEFGKNKLNLLLAIFTGSQIPYVFYKNAILKSIKATLNSSIKTVWIQIIKCYLIRKEVNIMPKLTQDVSTAYACGQLFAVYEELQYTYARQNGNKKLNKNLAQNYFSATIKQPGVFFPKLADLAIVYINGIRSSWHYTELLGELSTKIGQSFPAHFTMDEQGQFILGYYQQKGAILKEIMASNKNADELNNNIKEEETNEQSEE